MQTILGASGQIGRELAKALKHGWTDNIRLVSRSPQMVNATDVLHPANLLDETQTRAAVAGSSIVYFTAGLPIDARLWEQQFPQMLQNVLRACAATGAKLVFFDNTYMYPQTAVPQYEDTPFAPYGRKGRVRAKLANMVNEAIANQSVTAMICRAPEFYGPGKTQSITNATVFDNLKHQRQAKIFLRDDTLRTLIYTPDASRAMALLGNTDDAYQQTWHLPCDDQRLTYRAIVSVSAQIMQQQINYRVLKQWQLQLAGLFNKTIRETLELLPRYQVDNIFNSDKFKQRFPDFRVTSYQEGIAATLDELD